MTTPSGFMGLKINFIWYYPYRSAALPLLKSFFGAKERHKMEKITRENFFDSRYKCVYTIHKS